jgi:hypothetical protein
MIFTEARRQRLENSALVEQEEMLSAALQELPHTLKLLYKSLNKKDTTRARKILGLICGQMGMVATHLGAEREASLLSRLWKQLRGGGGAAAGMAGTEATEAVDPSDWPDLPDSPPAKPSTARIKEPLRDDWRKAIRGLKDEKVRGRLLAALAKAKTVGDLAPVSKEMQKLGLLTKAGTEAVEADESGTKVVDRVGRYFLVSYPGRRTTRGKNEDWWEARYTTKGGTEAKFALITLPTDAKDENDYTVSVGTLKPSMLAMDFDSLGDAFRKAIKWWEKHHAGKSAS